MKTAIILFLALSLTADAALIVKVSPPKTVGSKSAIKLIMKNTFSERIESARATIFLVDAQEKVVGQSVKWVIGGTKDKPPLEADLKTTFNFVVSDSKPFTKVKVLFNRVILEKGKLADPTKDVEISFAEEEEKK